MNLEDLDVVVYFGFVTLCNALGDPNNVSAFLKYLLKFIENIKVDFLLFLRMFLLVLYSILNLQIQLQCDINKGLRMTFALPLYLSLF